MTGKFPSPAPRGTPAGEFAQFLQDLTTGTTERRDLLEVFYSAYAVSFFTSAYNAFFIKSAGGSDETGHSWKDISPRTKAYSRKSARKYYDIPNVNPLRPTLTEEQDRIWREIFVTRVRKNGGNFPESVVSLYRKSRRDYLNRTLTTSSAKDVASQAAAYAWAVLKKTYGATTLYQLLGDEPLPILKRSGDLLNSYKPGSGVPYQPVPNQYFRVVAGKVSLGTTIPYAKHAFRERRLIPPGNNLWHRRAMRDGLNAVRERLGGTT
jgi:hypothetical protein